MRILILLFLLPQAAQVARPERPTLVRVVDQSGKSLAGARVFFVHAPFPEKAPLYGSERLEYRTGERGRVRVRLSKDRAWSVWSVWDDPSAKAKGARLASALTRVSPGRPQRLRLEPFPVPNARLIGLEAWRKLLGERLGLAFVSLSEPATMFRVPLPDAAEGEDGPVVRVAPLPLGNFFPALVDGSGGFLDSVYFSPAFHEGDADVEPLYERDYPLKRVELGKPVLLACRVVDSTGEAVAAARIFVRPDTRRSPLQLERVLQSDAEGGFELLAALKERQRTRYPLQISILAPGYRPLHATVSFEQLQKSQKQVFRLARGQELDWRLANASTEDRKNIYLQAQLDGVYSFVRLFPIECTAEGKLLLPSPSAAPGRVFELYLVRGALQVPVLAPGHGVPETATIDLDVLVPVELELSTLSGRPAPGGTVRIRRNAPIIGDKTVKADRGTQVVQGVSAAGFWSSELGYTLDRSGRARILLMPGEYSVLAEHDKLGDGHRRFAVAKDGKLQVSIQLRPYWILRGHVLGPDESPLAGVQVNASGTRFTKSDEQDYAPYLRGFTKTTTTSSDGSFELSLSVAVEELNVYANKQIDGSFFYANRTVGATQQEPIELVLHQ